VLAAVWLAARLAELRDSRRVVSVTAIAAIATLCPFGMPALAAETAWAVGIRYPRALNWQDAEALAGAIAHHGSAAQPATQPVRQLVADYPARDMSCDRGLRRDRLRRGPLG
jgi:hypothetical protein